MANKKAVDTLEQTNEDMQAIYAEWTQLQIDLPALQELLKRCEDPLDCIDLEDSYRPVLERIVQEKLERKQQVYKVIFQSVDEKTQALLKTLEPSLH